jgi:hypothetical protein
MCYSEGFPFFESFQWLISWATKGLGYCRASSPFAEREPNGAAIRRRVTPH